MTDERIALGWGKKSEPDYVFHYDTQQAECDALLADADVVISGSAPEKLTRRCIREGKIVFRYSERPLKKGDEWGKYLPRLIKWHISGI